MGKSVCVTRIIPDTPPQKDRFEGDAHQNLALAIKEIIDNENGGKTIGLEGEWGSGKSTIIHFLIANLDKQNNSVFLFDAWAHEGDPLRRTFLERLIVHLRDIKWISDNKAEIIINRLSGKQITSNVINKPKLSKIGIIAVIATVLAPIGLAFLKASLDNKMVLPWMENKGFDYYFLLFTGIYILPWLVTLIVALIKKDYSVLFREYITEKTTISNESPNPTSVEFETIFREVLIESLENKKRKLIIVFDNLDRIPEEVALDILSTLQTFLQYCQQSISGMPLTALPSLERLWVVIPYDRSGIIKLWEKNGGDDISAHMLDKRFQIRFRVPPLVLSNWRNYLFDLLKEAMPGHSSSEELENIYQIISLTWEKYSLSDKKDKKNESQFLHPTPRQLISLVNQIGSIHRQWCSRGIPFSHIVFYSTFRYLNPSKKLDDPTLRSEAFPEKPIPSFFYDSKSNLWESIAALWFNVDKEIANQILFREQIISALKNGNLKELEAVKEQTSRIWEIIRASYSHIYIGFNSIEDYLNTIYSLEKCKLLVRENSNEYKEFLGVIERGLTQNEISHPLTKEVGQQLISALKLISSPKFEEKLLTILNFDKEISEKETFYSTENISNWVDACLVLLPEILGLMKNSETIKIPGNIDTKAAALIFLAEKDPDKKFWHLFDLPETNQFIEGVTHFIQNGKITKKNSEFINLANDLFEFDKKDNHWSNLLSLLSTRIRHQPGERNFDEIVGLYHAFWVIMAISDENKTQGERILVAQHINEGFLLHYFMMLAEKPQYEDTAELLFYYLATVPHCAAPNSSDPGKAREGFKHLKQDIFNFPEKHFEITSKFIDILIIQERLDLLEMIWGKTPDSKKWISYCMEILLERTTPQIKELNPIFLSENWQEIKKFLGEKWENFLAQIVKKTSLLDHLSNEEFSISKSNLCQEIIRLGENKRTRNFCNNLLDRMRKIDKDVWYDEFTNSSRGLIQLVDQLEKSKYEIKLGLQFADALIDYCSDLLKGTRDRCIDSKVCSYIGIDSEKKYLRSKIFDLLNDTESIPAIFFTCFGSEIMDKDVLMNNKKAVEKIFHNIVDQENKEGLKWLEAFFEDYPDLLSQYEPKYAVDTLKKKINSKLDSELDQDVKLMMELLSKKLKN